MGALAASQSYPIPERLATAGRNHNRFVLNSQPDLEKPFFMPFGRITISLLAVAGSIVGLVLWPALKAWKSEQQFRAAYSWQCFSFFYL